MYFHCLPHDHHQTVYVPQPSIIMSNTNDTKSFFNDPSDIEMDDFPLLKQPLRIKQSLQSIQSAFQHDHSPIKALPVVPQLPLTTTPSLPIYLSTLSSLNVYNPNNHIIYEKTFLRWKREQDLSS